MNESSLVELAASITEPIVILVPSRGRPHNIVELIAAWRETAAGGFAALVVIVDNDDPEVEHYLEAWQHFPDITAHIIVSSSEERLRLGGTLNAFAPVFAVDNGGACPRLGVGFMGDDHRPRSAAWDFHLRDELYDVELEHGGRIGVVYGNDQVHGRNLPTAVVLGAGIIVELGYMVPPGAIHLYFDNFWLALGRALGTVRYLEHVVIQHLHPVAGTAPNDARYDEVNAGEVYAHDEARFTRYVDEELNDAVAAILEARHMFANTETEGPTT